MAYLLVLGAVWILIELVKLSRAIYFSRVVSANVHIQAKTEDAEHVDFGVTLYEDESEEEVADKLEKFFLLAEGRRKYNNDRMQARQEALRKDFEANKAQLSVVNPKR